MKRLLLIDDDEAFRRILAETLERAGYEVLNAENGAVALKLFQAQPVDLVITDLIMPEKEGIETMLELHKLQPALKVIVMSGGGRVDASDYLPIARQLGAARTLAKPFRSQEILDAVAELLAKPS
jgi:DNA-binding NtrC family response regulator